MASSARARALSDPQRLSRRGRGPSRGPCPATLHTRRSLRARRAARRRGQGGNPIVGARARGATGGGAQANKAECASQKGGGAESETGRQDPASQDGRQASALRASPRGSVSGHGVLGETKVAAARAARGGWHTVLRRLVVLVDILLEDHRLHLRLRRHDSPFKSAGLTPGLR